MSANRTLLADYISGVSAPRNYILNPQALKNTANITDADSIVTRTTANAIDGEASFEINADASGELAAFLGAPLKKALHGQACEAEFDYAGPAGLYKAYVQLEGVTVSQEVELIDTSADSAQHVSIIFPCGSSPTDVPSIVIESTDATPGTFQVDNFYLGAARNIGTVAQAYDFGSLTYPLESTCTWENSSVSFTTPAAFSAVTACATPVVTGKVTAPSTKIPAFVIPAGSPSGTYNIYVTGSFQSERESTQSNSIFGFHDGSADFNIQLVGMNAVSSGATLARGKSNVLAGSYKYISSAVDTTIEIRGASVISGSNAKTRISNSSTIADATGAAPLTFNVTFFPDSSQTVVRGDVTDLSGFAKSPATASCEWQTTSATMASFSADSDCPDSSTTYTSSGNLVAPDTKIPAAKAVTILPGKYMVVAGGSFEARESSSGFQSCLYEIYDGSSSGGIIRLGSDVSKGRNSTSTLVGQFEYSSKETNKTFQVRATRASGNGTCDIRAIEADLTFTLIPLSQGITKPFIPGSTYFGRPGVVKAGVATINCSSSSSIGTNTDGMISSVGNVSSGVCAITLTTGYFSSTPVCFGNSNENLSGMVFISTTASSATSVTWTGRTFDGSSSGSPDGNIICIGDN
jgi:hypothetical protein